jgi:hypothetical protein
MLRTGYSGPEETPEEIPAETPEETITQNKREPLFGPRKRVPVKRDQPSWSFSKKDQEKDQKG